MITIIPSLEIMKAVTDNNITSPASTIRRKAFDFANEITSLANVDILLEGRLYRRIEQRLNDDHKAFFESVYRIDKSVIGIGELNITAALCWVAKSEAKTRRVIILTENSDFYVDVATDKIKLISPQKFIDRVKIAILMYEKRMFCSVDDALMAVFFLEAP